MNLPTYFILDGFHAYTSDLKPKNLYFEGQVRPKGYDSVIKVVAINPLAEPHTFTTSLPKKNIPVYKSNLQKCVRRQLSDRAIRTAYAMMSVDTPDLLRRIPIIMLEDVLPHPCMIVLVWWMMASTKGYLLSDDEVSYVLGIIYLICHIDEYQVTNSECKSFGEMPGWGHLPKDQKDLLWALEFRKAYRGMSCDVEMIEYLQRQWFARFTSKTNPVWKMLNQKIVELVDLQTIGECDKDDLILEAIDYHCFRWLTKKLHDKFPIYQEGEIKGAIWFYRSRLNNRKVCQGSRPVKHVHALEPVYVIIRDDVERLCQWIFDHLI